MGMSTADLQQGFSESEIGQAAEELASFNRFRLEPDLKLHEVRKVPLLACYRKRRCPE